MKAMLIFNPVAGAREVERELEQVIDYWEGRGWQVNFRETWGAGDATTFAREAVTAGCQAVFVAGGDGTLGEVAGGLAVLDLYEKQGFTEKAAQVGKWLQAGVKELQEKYELIGDVRALGTMVGIELVESRETKEPATAKRNRLIELTFKKGLLILGAGKSSVRLAPVHTMTEDEVKIGVKILDQALAEITG